MRVYHLSSSGASDEQMQAFMHEGLRQFTSFGFNETAARAGCLLKLSETDEQEFHKAVARAGLAGRVQLRLINRPDIDSFGPGAGTWADA